MPPKTKKKKITWCNASCKADKCLEPPSKSIWLNCDVCGYWYHEDCIGVKAEDYPDDLEFYCYKCHPSKLEEYDSLKAKLVIKVQELAGAQKDFGGPTISRDMFKEKKNAGQYNFSSDFPPTLTDLCSRITGTYKTFGDFKYESSKWISRLKELLLDKYESDLQFIDWEFQDYVEDLLKGEEEEEPDYASNEDQDASNEELDVESTNKLFENTVIKTEIPDEYPEDYVVQRPPDAVGKCQNCSTDFTDIIYLCKRKHKICHSCRLLNSGCICPLCHNVHGDRKRLVKDPVFQNDHNDLDFVSKPKKVRKRKSQDQENALPKIGDSWSCTAVSNNIVPPRIPSSSPQGPLSIVDVMSVPIKQEPDLIQENLFSTANQQDQGSTCAIQSVQSLHPSFSWNPPELNDSGGTELIEADFNITSLAEAATNELVHLTDANGPSIQLQENVMFSEDAIAQHDVGDFQQNVILTEVLDVPDADEGINHQIMDPFHALQQCSDQELLDQVVIHGGNPRMITSWDPQDEIDLQTMNPEQENQIMSPIQGNQSNMPYWINSSPQNVSIVDGQISPQSRTAQDPNPVSPNGPGWIRVQGKDIELPRQPVQIGQPVVVQQRSREEERNIKNLNSIISKIPASILDKIPNTSYTVGSNESSDDSFIQSHPLPIPKGSPVKSSTQQVQNNQPMLQISSQSYQNKLAAQGAIQVPLQIAQTQQQKIGLQLVNTSKLMESGN